MSKFKVGDLVKVKKDLGYPELERNHTFRVVETNLGFNGGVIKIQDEFGLNHHIYSVNVIHAKTDAPDDAPDFTLVKNAVGKTAALTKWVVGSAAKLGWLGTKKTASYWVTEPAMAIIKKCVTSFRYVVMLTAMLTTLAGGTYGYVHREELKNKLASYVPTITIEKPAAFKQGWNEWPNKLNGNRLIRSADRTAATFFT